MNTKHTPGPWNIRYFRTEEPELGFFVEAKNNNMPELGYGIEIMMDDFGDHNGYPLEQKLADAKLISAAPELLEAAKYAVECLNRLNAELGQIGDNGDQALQSLEAAIQKAEQ